MENKVWCEDCKWVDLDWVFYSCKNKVNRTYIDDYPGPYVARPVERIAPRAVCHSFNEHGDCPQYEKKQPLLVQLKELFRGRS